MLVKCVSSTFAGTDDSPQYFDTPMIVSRELEFPTKDGRSRRAWVENIDSIKERKLGLIDLHPEIFAVQPRIDMIWMNARWQMNYRNVVCENLIIKE